MSKPDYLVKLEERSKKNQETFMLNIADRLGRARVTNAPTHPFRGTPKFWEEFDLPFEEKIHLFVENWRKAGGEAERFPDVESAARFIAEVAEKMQAKYILRANHPELATMNLEQKLPATQMTVWNPENGENLLAKAAGADMGIVMVDYAVAYTGSLVHLSSASKGRSISLLPTCFIAIVKAETIKTRLGEVMKELTKLNEGDLPAGIHFISGPSRSADIENDLTIGVHGPGIAYALIID